MKVVDTEAWIICIDTQSSMADVVSVVQYLAACFQADNRESGVLNFFTNKPYFGIDLIGFPGEYEAAFPLSRHSILKRASLAVHPISYIDWLLRKEQCLEAIFKYTKGKEN